jgi:antitoxin MazE
METHLAHWGNSLALRIPKTVADRLGLVEGQAVKLTVETDRLVVRAHRLKPSLDELLAGITPENLPASFDDGPLGNEAL